MNIVIDTILLCRADSHTFAEAYEKIAFAVRCAIYDKQPIGIYVNGNLEDVYNFWACHYFVTTRVHCLTLKERFIILIARLFNVKVTIKEPDISSSISNKALDQVKQLMIDKQAIPIDGCWYEIKEWVNNE